MKYEVNPKGSEANAEKFHYDYPVVSDSDVICYCVSKKDADKITQALNKLEKKKK